MLPPTQQRRLKRPVEGRSSYVCQSKPAVNWWYAQALDRPNTDLVPKWIKRVETASQFRTAAERGHFVRKLPLNRVKKLSFL